MRITLNVNGESRSADVDEDTPLLWVLRESFGLTGTKFGCGVAACGACTVHVNGSAARSCSIPAASLQDQTITTIEGLAPATQPHPLQAAWIAHQVPQCGYCQSGMIMA
ncbi:MAG: (2Fe-2S)-binding protein, partial [Steroidobacteraceae bacterium]